MNGLKPFLAEDQVQELMRNSHNPGGLSATDLIIVAAGFVIAIGISAIVGMVYLKTKRRRDRRDRGSSGRSRSSKKSSRSSRRSRSDSSRNTVGANSQKITTDSGGVSGVDEKSETPPATT
jgi:hypothetical protein